MTEPRIDTATILRRTFALLRADPLPGIVAMIVLTAVSVTLTALRPAENTLLFWTGDLTGIIVNFLLIAAVTRRAGMMRDGSLAPRLFHFLGLWVVTGAAILTGLFLLVLPGIYLWARWMMALPLAVAEGRPMFDAIGESWRRTRSFVAPISAAILLAASGFIAGTLLNFFVSRALGVAPLPFTVLSSALSYASTILLWYLSIALCDLLREGQGKLENIFA